jgi:hypothetical protein
MRIKTALLQVFVAGFVSLAVAASRIIDESYRLARQLFSYKNREIDSLHTLNQYMLDCQNVSNEESVSKKCSGRLTAMQEAANDLQVQHDVLGHEIESHIRQHKDEECFSWG